MIIKAFKENQTFTLLISLLVSALLWLLVGFKKTYEPDYHTLFNSSIYILFPTLKTINSHRLLCTGINLLFIFLNGIYLSRIAFKYQLLPRRTLLPLFLFILLSFPYFISYIGLSYPLITLTLVLKVIQILYDSLEKQKIAYGYFDSALLISIASIFNLYSAFLLIFLIYVLFQFKGIQIRELIFILVGLIVPYILFLGGLYLFDLDIKAYIQSYGQMFSMRTTYAINHLVIILFAFSSILILISSMHMVKSFVKMKIVTRKYSIVFFGLFVSAVLIAVFYPIADRDILFYITLPISYLMGYYFATCKPNLINHLLFVFLIAGNLIVLFY